MKKLFLILALLPTVTFISCSDDDDDPNWGIVPTEVRNTFSEKYPSAQKIEWENKGTYKVADFINNSMETTAWFDPNGVWYMTETDLPYNSLPQAVKDAFKASKYSTWKVDDVDMLERKNVETVYIIEVESTTKKEIDLYYNVQGILVKTVEDDNDNDDNDYENQVSQVTPTDIEKYIKEKYPQSKIVEIERENGRVEVDIIHDNKGKEVVFNTSNQWLSTSWDVNITSLPPAVASIVNNPNYSGYRIDEADFVETPQNSYYLLELEKVNSEIKVKVDVNGNVLN